MLRKRPWRGWVLAVGWASYLVAFVALTLVAPALGTALGIVALALLVFTGIWLNWWEGLLVLVALVAVEVVVQGTGRGRVVDINLTVGPALGPALSLLVFGLALLATGWLFARASRAVVRARLAAFERDASHKRESDLALVMRGAAHEIANPITAMRLELELLQIQVPAGTTHDAVGRIDRSLHRLERLVQDLRDAAKSLQEGQELRLQETDLAPLLRDLAADQGQTCRAAGLQWSAQIPPSLPCRVDPERIAQAVQNLCQNAIRYTKPGGAVSLEAHLEGETVAVSVSDTGIGLSPDEAARLFEPFVRLHPSETKGMGLGLWITRGIARAHGGDVKVESQGQGKGSRFTLAIPQRGAAGAESRPTPRQLASSSAGSDGAPAKA